MKRPARIALIAAVARNRAIGRDNALLFHEAADQRHFRQTTLGCPVLMGRKTWDSLPPRFRPLPGRRNVVVSRNPQWRAGGVESGMESGVDGGVNSGAERCDSLGTALELLQAEPLVFVIGGAQLYAQALPLADQLVLTEIDADLDGDVFFPDWDRTQFDEVSRHDAQTAAGIGYHFVVYQRKRPTS